MDQVPGPNEEVGMLEYRGGGLQWLYIGATNWATNRATNRATNWATIWAINRATIWVTNWASI